MSAIAQRRAAGAAALMILLYLLQVALFAPSAGADHIPTTGTLPEYCEKIEDADLGVEGLEVTVAGQVDVAFHGWVVAEAASNEFASVMVDVSGLADGELHWQTKAGADGETSEVNEGVIVSDGTHSISRAEDASLAISHITLCALAPTPEASADLTVVNQVDVISGNPSTTAFDVSVTGHADVTLADGDETSFTYDLSAEESLEVAIAVNAIAESGWSTSISCDNGESGDALVELVLTEGDDVICTITNTFGTDTTPPTTSPPTTPESGTVVIQKATTGIGDARAFMFSFDGELFALADGESATFSDLAAGSYVAAEIQGEAAGGVSWSIADLACDDPSADSVVSIDALADADEVAGSAAIELAAGETVACTFTNAPTEVEGTTVTTTSGEVGATTTGSDSGTIVIQKATTATGDNRAFVFSFDGELFALADGESATFTDLAAGTYAAAEIQGEAASGFSWSIADLTCDDPSADTVVSIDALADADEVAGSAVIELAAGETVACTFTNAPTEVLGVTVTTAGDDVASTPPGEVAAETLPFTGFEAADSVKVGLLGLLAGALTLFAVRGTKEEEASVDLDSWSNS